MEVKDIVKPAVTVSEDATFEEALRAMLNGQTNTLLVTDEDGVLSGEVSVVDLLDAIVPGYLDGDSIMSQLGTEKLFQAAVKEAKDRPVIDFMSADFTSVSLDDSLITIAATAIAHRRARIPVVDRENHPIGIISRQGLKIIIARFLGLKTPSGAVLEDL